MSKSEELYSNYPYYDGYYDDDPYCTQLSPSEYRIIKESNIPHENETIQRMSEKWREIVNNVLRRKNNQQYFNV